MKTRSGFVSNSSSTSFTIIVSEAAYKRVYESVDDNAKELMKSAWGTHGELCEKFVIEGMTLINMSFIDHDGGFWQEVCDEMDREDAYEDGKTIIDAFQKDPGAYVNTDYC